MSRRLGLTSAFVLMACLAILGVPNTSAQRVSITIEAGEGNDCSGDDTFCFVVASGSLDDLTGGANVTLDFVNDGSTIHNVYVAPPDAGDDDHQDTPGSAAYANTDDVGPGGDATLNFTVPQGDDGVYIWCDVQGHEQLGMWTTNAAADGGNGDEPEDAPLSAWVVALAITGALLVATSGPGRR